MNPKGLRLFLVFVAITSLPACGKKAEPTAISKRGLKPVAFPVETLKVDAKPHELLVTAPGYVDAFEHVQVTARVAGVVDKVTFTEGQEVKQGASLALIDSRRYALAVSSARAALEKAKATSADSETSLKRRQDAVATNPGLIPGEEMATYETHLQTANADVNSANEALKLAQLNMDDSTVKAASGGIIQTRTVQTGQYVNAGTVIATLLRSDPMLLRFNVTTAEAPRLKVGMDAPFTLKESHDTYTAKITLVGGAADPDSRLVPITGEVVADHKFWLRPGTFAEVHIVLTSQRQYPMIPEMSARPSDRGFLAYVVNGDTVSERKLELGLHTTDGFVEAKSGVNAGDLIVTKGIEALSDGAKVRLGGVPNTGGAPAGSASAAWGAAAPAGSGAHDGTKHRKPGAAASGTPPSGAASVASP